MRTRWRVRRANQDGEIVSDNELSCRNIKINNIELGDINCGVPKGLYDEYCLNKERMIMKRESDFREDLKEVLDKHCARLFIDDNYIGYGLHGPTLMVEIDDGDDIEEFEY